MSSKKINRRQFIQTAATVAAATALTDSSTASSLGQIKKTMQKQDKSPDFKKTEGFQSLINHVSGIPLGGIGAGTVELRPDGYFHDWLIFNTGGWAPSQPDHERDARPDMPAGALSFSIRTKQGTDVKVRRLGIREDQNELYSLGWVQSVEGIRFNGRFPIAELDYQDATLPVEVSALAFSPVIPHDSRISGTPGFTIEFTVKNTSTKPVEVSLLSMLKNPVAWGLPDRKLANAVKHDASSACLTMSTSANGPKLSSIGSLSLSVNGGKPSWIAADSDGYLGNGGWRWTPYGNSYESVFLEFTEDGALTNSSVPHDLYKSLPTTNEEIEKLTDGELKTLAGQMRSYASLDAFARKLLRVSNEGFTRDLLIGFLKVCRDRLIGEKGDQLPNSWNNGALCTWLKLKPGEKQTVRFTLSWFFPHHFSERGPEMGHAYENWFSDSESVNRFMVKNFSEHKKKVLAFVDTLFDTNLPEEMPACWSSQLSTLTKCTWWTKVGQFAVWEGLGCCGFHTTDITYQGSFNILALWPELQLGQMAMGAAFQRQDGRVHHFFTPDLMQVDGGFDRVDMNPQFVMLVCRDYMWTGNTDYLRRLWPNIVRAMANTAELDADGDGLPDHDTRRNTYDAWDFEGTPSYIASLWLGALRAGIRLATDLGETQQVSQWTELLDKGSKAFETRLWNSEYYSLWNSGEARDECCMSDQMSGEWFTNLMGIGHSLPPERVSAALKAVVKHNYSPDRGLMNATYPAEKPARYATYRNGQAAANWTGIEYAIASMMMDFGLYTEGLNVVKSVHRRYARAGRNWNHVECGSHYYRAMSSWATLLAATGFKPDLPSQTLVLTPAAPRTKLIAPWISSTGFGTINHNGTKLSLSCKSGTLGFKRLVTLLVKPTTVKLAGKPVEFKLAEEDGKRVIVLNKPITMSAGQELSVS